LLLLLLLLVRIPRILLHLLRLGLAAAMAMVVVPNGVVMVVELRARRELMCYVKPCGHPHEPQCGDEASAKLLEDWAHAIAHHWCHGQHEGCQKELWVVRDPGDEQQGQAEAQQHDDLQHRSQQKGVSTTE
jgi:hypothetical protein